MMEDDARGEDPGIVESRNRALAELFDHLIVFFRRLDRMDLKRDIVLASDRVRVHGRPLGLPRGPLPHARP